MPAEVAREVKRLFVPATSSGSVGLTLPAPAVKARPRRPARRRPESRSSTASDARSGFAGYAHPLRAYLRVGDPDQPEQHPPQCRKTISVLRGEADPLRLQPEQLGGKGDGRVEVGDDD
jgi:hypothetical protein